MKDLKLGFIVEGDTDKIIVESFARRILPSSVRFHTIRLGGKAAFSTAYTSVFVLLNKQYDHVIILFDTDTTDEAKIVEEQLALEATLKTHQLEKQVTVCPVVPEIEAWLLANYLKTPETYRDLKAKLLEVTDLKHLSTPHLEQLSSKADIDLIQERNKSFAQFTQTLRNLSNQPAFA